MSKFEGVGEQGSRGAGEQGSRGDKGDKGEFTAMPNAQCPMPHAQCPMPHAPCPMPLTPILLNFELKCTTLLSALRIFIKRSPFMKY
ncbi:MAG: hypothetical protein ACRAVC_18540 [Trichormus sp.]